LSCVIHTNLYFETAHGESMLEKKSLVAGEIAPLAGYLLYVAHT
jgi:hypothetical protein